MMRSRIFHSLPADATGLCLLGLLTSSGSAPDDGTAWDVDPANGERILRGGDFSRDCGHPLLFRRHRAQPARARADYGARCARSLP